MVAENGSKDHIEWLEADIGALRESISLTRSLLATMAMSARERCEAEQLILTSEQKIRDLNAVIERYRQINDGIDGSGGAHNA